MSVQNVPGFDLQPSAQRVPLESNYITNFDSLISIFLILMKRNLSVMETEQLHLS